MANEGWNKSGGFGGGYLQRKFFPRTAVLSSGFALVVAAAEFSAALTIPPIAQSQVEGYRAKPRIAYQTEPQQGWLYTGATPPAFDATTTVAPHAQTQFVRVQTRSQYRPPTEFQIGWMGALPEFYSAAIPDTSGTQFDRTRTKPTRSVDSPAQDGWLYTGSTPVGDVWNSAKFQNTESQRLRDRLGRPALWQDDFGWLFAAQPVAGDTWNASKFQNNESQRMGPGKPRPADYLDNLGWVYTSLPIPDTWSLEKFQNTTGDRMAQRDLYDPRLDYHKFSFGLLDARPILPAYDQLAQSYRLRDRQKSPIVTPDSYGWLYTAIPTPFDARLVIHSDDQRMRDRYAKVPQLDQPSQAWIYAGIPPFDARLFIQGVAPYRMDERHDLDPRLQSFYNDLSWLHDVLGLVDTPLILTAIHLRPIAPIMSARRRRRR